LPIHLSEYEQSDRLQRVHLDQMPQDWQGRSLKAMAIQLIISKKKEAPKLARQLVERVNMETDGVNRDDILELIETILIYKYPDQTRQEIATMLRLSDLKQTRVYQDAHQEGEQKVISLLLSRKYGELPLGVQTQIQSLSTEQLETLAVSLLDFTSIEDLVAWLQSQ
jgi:predicted transposase YdaD